MHAFDVSAGSVLCVTQKHSQSVGLCWTDREDVGYGLSLTQESIKEYANEQGQCY